MRVFDDTHIFAPRDFCMIDRAPICLEIGAGKGRHAHRFCQNNPDKTLYAIERTADKYTAFAKLHTQLPNLHFVHADAVAWSVFALYPKQVTECFILYPNPEPHNKNQRWTNMPFFAYLLSRMADDGVLYLASNIPQYIQESTQNLEHIWHLPYRVRTVGLDEQRTHFEAKYTARGELCQEIIITKPKNYVTHFDMQLPKYIRGSI